MHIENKCKDIVITIAKNEIDAKIEEMKKLKVKLVFIFFKIRGKSLLDFWITTFHPD